MNTDRDWNALREAKANNYAIEDADWRLRRVHRVEAVRTPEGHQFKLGPRSALITGVAISVEAEKFSLEFRSPSPAAMMLDAAWQLARQAMDLQAAVKPIRIDGAPNGYRRYEIPRDQSTSLFDYLQPKIASILLAYAALEAFCNDALADKLVPGHKLPHCKGKKAIEMPSEELQRWATTEWKLARLVPDLLGVVTPSGGRHWEAFARLKELRDNATHFKARKHSEGLGTEDNSVIVGVLYSLPCFEPAEDALSIIRYFYKDADLPPRWLLNPAWRRP